MIDTYFKQYFWTFHLAAIGAAGLLVANVISVFLGESLRLPPEQTPAATTAVASVKADSKKSPFPVSAFLEKNVFKAMREDLEAERLAREEAEREMEDTGDGNLDLENCSKSSMSKTLVATVVTSQEDLSVAVFSGGSKEETVAFRVGDKLDSATVRRIIWRRVLIDNGGKCEYFTMETEEGPTAAKSPVAEVAKPATNKTNGKPDLATNVKKVSETEYEIPRGDIDNVLSNLSVVATQARIVPSFQNGKPNGFKLFSIRPGSLYSKIGVQNGDIIQKINGYEINSPDKAFEIYSKLKDSTAITVDLVRRGRTKTMTYNVR